MTITPTKGRRPREGRGPTVERLARAQMHPTRRAIVKALAEFEPQSPSMLSRALDEPLGNVSYHVKSLFEDSGVLELHHTTPRRGAVEHFYQRVDRSRTAAEITDEEAIDEIAALIETGNDDGDEAIAAIVRRTGRVID